MLVLAVCSVAACSGSESGDPTTEASTGDDTPTTSPTDTTAAGADTTTVPPTTPPTTATTTPTTVPAPDLDIDGDLLLFGPVPPRPADRPDLPLPDGSDDYFDLFERPDLWADSLAELDVFKLHGWMVKHYLTDDQLVVIDSVLRAHGVALMIEAEPLAPPDPAECDHTESFEGPYELESLRRLRDLGVDVAAVAIEQPLHMAHLLTGPGACQYTLERIFDELVVWRDDLREIYPDAEFGTIEAVWDITTAEDYERWHDGWLAASGEPFAFQHLDINWLRPDWIDVTLEIEAVVEARGIPFGILYNGGLASSNDDFIHQTMLRVAEYEAAGGTPAHTMFQSWVEQPDHVLPDDDTSGFSHLIRRYRSGPTSISLDVDPGVVRGTVTRADGSAVGDADVTATALPTGGTRQIFTGTADAPPGATEAFVVMRFNGEEAVTGDVATTLYEITVTQGDGTNLLPNGSFDQGLDGWGVYDTNTGTTTIAGGDDAAMAVLADPTQEVWIDGTAFPITPGEPITLAIDAAVGNQFEGGRVALIFPNAGEERGRLTVPLLPTPIDLGTVTTADDGSFELLLSEPVDGGGLVTLVTDGDALTWPAWAETEMITG
jgi:hypothetical protein